PTSTSPAKTTNKITTISTPEKDSPHLLYVDLSEDDDEDDDDDQDEDYDITRETRGANSTKISETSRSTSPSVALN
ncbi:hypothetical protein WICPIJ_000386, partial [Wickerhamomyces pijperi]